MLRYVRKQTFVISLIFLVIWCGVYNALEFDLEGTYFGM